MNQDIEIELYNHLNEIKHHQIDQFTKYYLDEDKAIIANYKKILAKVIVEHQKEFNNYKIICETENNFDNHFLFIIELVPK